MPERAQLWRRPGKAAVVVWPALALLCVGTFAGPAPLLVPAAMTAVVGLVLVVAYGPWRSSLRHGVPGADAVLSGWERLSSLAGYGPDGAEIVLRPRLVVRVLCWPLLPWTTYCRLELRDGVLRPFGHPLCRRSVDIEASTFRIAREPGLGMSIYRVFTIEDPLRPARIRFSLMLWSRWRRLAAVLDPQNSMGLDLVEPR